MFTMSVHDDYPDSKRLGKDNVMIVGTITGIIVVLVLIFIILKYRHSVKAERESERIHYLLLDEMYGETGQCIQGYYKI